MNNPRNFIVKKLILSFVMVLLATLSYADDTEIFSPPADSANTDLNSNVLFIMDNSGSMKEIVPNSEGKTRLQVMQNALQSVMASAPDNLNVGMMNYGDSTRRRKDHPNGIRFPVTPIEVLARPVVEQSITIDGTPRWNLSNIPEPSETVTVRTYLNEIANSWTSYGMTPIVDSLYEAALYYRGERMDWGFGLANKKHAAHPASYANQAPDMVRPLDSVMNVGSCDGRPRIHRKYNNAITAWRNGNTGGYICPSSRFSPSGPGSADNCALTEFNCGSSSYTPCTSWSAGTPAIPPSGCSGGQPAIPPSGCVGGTPYQPPSNCSGGSPYQPPSNCSGGSPYQPPSGCNSGTPSTCNSTDEDGDCNGWTTAIPPSCSIPAVPAVPATCATPAVPAVPATCATPAVPAVPETCSVPGIPAVPVSCTNPGTPAGPRTCQTYGTPRVTSWCSYASCRDTVREKPKYVSPIIGECQSNNIILMTDGKPEYKRVNQKPFSKRNIKRMMGSNNCQNAPFGFKAGECGSEFTHFLSGTDNSASLEGEQPISTYVIGFSSGVTAEATNYLKSLVTVEDDASTPEREGYFSAENEAQLADAFRDALENIANNVEPSLSSPTYSVNMKSKLAHNNEVYIPVFKINDGALWSGNIKKFRMVTNGNTRHIRGKTTRIPNEDGDGYIDAMDDLGVFKGTAWDDWSNNEEPDGQDITKGGVAELLTSPNTRKLYTNMGNSDLTASSNQIVATNNSITLSLLGGSLTGDGRIDPVTGDLNIAPSRSKLINFIRGWQGGVQPPALGATPRLHMGDMLHSSPVAITYKNGDASEQLQYLFAATNEGYLHAFDSKTGLEKWAFMPKELLKNVNNQFTQVGDHQYGIDGKVSYWHKDSNDNGDVDDGEQILLYFGLRRGGRSYYALDISNINSPKLIWKVDNETAGFSRLGQSWSRPYIANIRRSGNTKPVVIFSGGNDPAQDYGKGDSYTESSVTGNVTATMGNDIFIVDAITGQFLWSMRNNVDNGSSVQHAIPGGVSMLDVNRNGALDRMYFADTGGNVWRLDLSESLTGESSLVKLASLGGVGVNARKFYNEPDVAMLRAGGRIKFTISLGSGLRPHPLNKIINDNMFVLIDDSPFNDLDDDEYTLITKSHLASVTTSGAGGGFGGKSITSTNKRGWFMNFADNGEKVLSSSITFDGAIIFTTTVPQGSATPPASGIGASHCEEGAQTSAIGRMYAINILTGQPILDLNSDDQTNTSDYYTEVVQNSIPETPQRVFGQLQCSNGSCKHNVEIRVGKTTTGIASVNVAEVETIYWSNPKASK